MSNKTIFIFLLFVVCSSTAFAQLPVVDNKGTKVVIDSSKWLLSSNNIVNKNSGNVGIGVTLPQYKLDVNAANPIRLMGLQMGTIVDSMIVSQNGVIKKLGPVSTLIINRPDSTTASNGLNLIGKDVRLGGNLTQPTTLTNNGNPLTFATNGTALNITGLPTGVLTDSIVTVQNGLIKKIASTNLINTNNSDSTTASNGLNLVGKDVRMGGNLTQPTTVTNNGNALTFATGGTALNITGLPTGVLTDSIVTVQNGLIKKIASTNLINTNNPDSTTASNGLNLNGKDVRMGGNLTQPTTVTNNGNPLTFVTNGSPLNISGLPTGTTTDSIVTVQNGLVRKIVSVNKPDSTTASNGLNLVGKDVRMGGNLTQPTTVTNNGNPLTFATNGTALNITGLPTGVLTDSILTVQNGLVKKIASNNLINTNNSDSTTASNGLNLNGKDVRMGGTLTQPTIVTNNGNALTFATNGSALNITGLLTGTATDSIITVQNGLVRKIVSINKPDSTTASNGLNLVGKDVRMGGNLTQPTTINNNGNNFTIATGGSDLNITGLSNGLITDSLVSVQNGVIKKLAPINTLVTNKPDSTTASNGLNLIGKDVRMGGNLTQPTTVANNGNTLTFATNGTALNITGLPTGVLTDSILTVQNGLVKKIASNNLINTNNPDSTTASNGLNLIGKDVRMGGNLTQSTTISNNTNALTFATGGANLNITGLPTGLVTDSIVTVQNGLIKKIASTNLVNTNNPDSTTASNGLNLIGKDVKMGGNLTQPTTVTNNGNPLTFATNGTALNITGLPSGASTDSLIVMNNATGQLRKIQMPDIQGRLVEIYDVAGTQTLTNAFTILNLGTTTIADAGFTIASGVITVTNAGLYKITYRATVRVTNNTASGAEFQLTNTGVAIPGTLGYTFQQNNNRSQGTVSIVKVVSLTAASSIAVQGRRYSAAGNLTLTANGSSLLIEKIR